jgi:hypothetical protein
MSRAGKPTTTVMPGHVQRDKNYALTGIALCDLLSVAHELETSRHCPPMRRAELAQQLRVIISNSWVAATRKPS